MGAGIGGAAAIAHPVLRRFYVPYLGVLGVGYAAGLALVIRSWPRRPSG
jgi:hypothetical protein